MNKRRWIGENDDWIWENNEWIGENDEWIEEKIGETWLLSVSSINERAYTLFFGARPMEID